MPRSPRQEGGENRRIWWVCSQPVSQLVDSRFSERLCSPNRVESERRKHPTFSSDLHTRIHSSTSHTCAHVCHNNFPCTILDSDFHVLFSFSLIYVTCNLPIVSKYLKLMFLCYSFQFYHIRDSILYVTWIALSFGGNWFMTSVIWEHSCVMNWVKCYYGWSGLHLGYIVWQGDSGFT